ncbi:MAG: hypothetical protein IT158_03975 [Bryobacterales bacterium]|nr:hypothetical protein [Bryobacterales bacterium]
MDSANALMRAFQEASGGTGGAVSLDSLLPQSGEEYVQALTEVSSKLQGLTTASGLQVEAVGSNTQAVLQNTVAQASSGGVKGAASMLSRVFGSGLGLSPLVTGIAKLFGGGKSEALPELIRYEAPQRLRFEWANTPGMPDGFAAVDSVQGGLPRSYRQPAGPEVQRPAERESERPAQITVQVQAMDSRSFLDHSGEIARAVREAMLNMHSLNDVVNEL